MEMDTTKSESRWMPVLFIAITLGTVLSPLAQNWSPQPKDNFPLSYYPMFSARRGSEYSTPSLLGLDAQGRRTILPYRFAGSGGFNEVRHQVRSRIGNGKAKSLCRKLARRIGREKEWQEKQIMTVQVITATHKMDAYFAGNKAALEEKVHASCPVEKDAKGEVQQ
jgi:hypothetical protein